MFEFFIDVEFWVFWDFFGDGIGFNMCEFMFEGILQCNGNGEVVNGGIGVCEMFCFVDGGLFDWGIVLN